MSFNSEDFQLIQLLPGLVMARNQLNEQIATIEQRLLKITKRPYVKKVKEVEETKKVKEVKNNARSEGMKRYWATLSPEKAKARRAKMGKGISETNKRKRALAAA